MLIYITDRKSKFEESIYRKDIIEIYDNLKIDDNDINNRLKENIERLKNSKL